MKARSIWGDAMLASAGGCRCGADRPARVEAGDPSAAEVASDAVVLVGARGAVETRRRGGWSAAAVGERLAADDAVRARAGSATVAIGAGAQVTLEPSSEVSLGAFSGDRARLRLQRGRLRASVRGDLTLEVESAGSSALAAAERGAFAIFNDGHGHVAVATRAGEVRLTSRGGAVTLGAGERASVGADAAPARREVPESVYLKVSWPEEKTTRRTEVRVAGEAAPSARVEVNGELVAVAADGSFEARVELADGDNRLEVRATDLHDRTAVQASSVVVRRRAPAVEAESEGPWE